MKTKEYHTESGLYKCAYFNGEEWVLSWLDGKNEATKTAFLPKSFNKLISGWKEMQDLGFYVIA